MSQRQRAVDGTFPTKVSRHKWFAIIVFVVLLSAVGVAWLLGRPALTNWTRQQLVDQARTHGFVLHVTEADYSLTSIRLGRATAELQGVAGVTLAIQSGQINLTRFKPTHIQLAAVRVQATGAPTQLLRQLDAWRAKYATLPTNDALPQPAFDNLQVTWRATVDGPELLQLSGVNWVRHTNPPASTAVDGTVTAAQVTAGHTTLQGLRLAVRYTTTEIELGFGATQLENAPMRAGWQQQAAADDLHLSFMALPVGPLLANLGVPNVDAKLAAVQAQGRISVGVPHDERTHYLGRMELDLRGWVPPHPAELDGLIFGNATNVQADVAIERSLTQAQLPHLALSSGALKLSGYGSVTLEAMTSAHLKAQLKGQLPCTALASAVVESKLGQAYGRWAASHAGRTVEGHVDVSVQIEANSAHLDQIKIAKRIGVGCGLKPLTLSDVLSLGLPPMPDADFLQHATRALPSLGEALPSAMPKWPRLPDWKVPHNQ